jgi:hypothetical protein
MGRKLKDFYLTVDLRSLALFRIFLGGLLIFDWFARWPDLEAFYTSFGVLPVEAPLPKSGGEFHFCLLDGVTSLPMVQAVFCAGLLFYVLFLLGYRTRTFQFLSFLFFTSALSRNVLIRDGSVIVVATMLLWSLFLPMGKRFSLDTLLARLRSANSDKASEPVPVRSDPSLAAFAIVAQLGLIYFFTAVAKSGQTWKDGTALYYALNWDQIARPLGQWLVSQPLPLIKTLTWSVLALEFAALPLILFPFGQPWLRRFAIVALGAMHVGIALTTTLGFFSAAMIACYALLLTPRDWELLKRLPGARRVAAAFQPAGDGRILASPQTHSAGTHAASKSDSQTPAPKIKPESEARLKAPSADRASRPVGSSDFGFRPSFGLRISAFGFHPLRARRCLVNAVVAVLFVTFTLDAYNINMAKRLGRERIPEPRWMRAIVLVPLLQHDWELFAPDPVKDDGWWVIAGDTESGEQLDPLTGQAPTFDKPPRLARSFTRFWRKYLDRIRLKKNYDYRLYFGKYITRKNHRESPAGRQLVQFNFYYVKEPTLPPGTPQPWPTERLLLWHHDCFPRQLPADAR